MKNQKKSLKKNNIQSVKNFGYYIPIIYIITITPLIVYGKTIVLPQEVANFWKGGLTHFDFFNYYKSINIMIGTFALICAYLGLTLNNRLSILREKKYYIPMIIYCIFAIISTFFSENKYIALEGFIEMNQGIFVLLSYIILAFIIMNYVKSKRDIEIIVYSFAILTIVEGILGVGQFLGYDFFKTTIGQWILSSGIFVDTELKFTFGSYTIYGTMYNTNFVGSFASLVLPLSIVNYLCEENRIRSIIFCIIAVLAFSVWIGCNSRAGYLGILISSIIGFVLFRKEIKKRIKKFIILIIIYISILLLFNAISNGKTLGQFLRLNPSNEVERIKNIKEEQIIRFKEISIDSNKLTLKNNKEILLLLAEDNNLKFEDEKGNILDINVENNEITFVDNKYEGYSFFINKKDPFKIRAYIYDRKLDLSIKNGEIKVISLNNKLTDPVEAPRVKLFDGRETFASNRGYIWSRTIPMLKDTLIIGYGPDNYPMVFPQEDYVGRFNVGNKGMLDIVVDKPHNMYLQTAINTGVISLLALLAIWGMYLFDSFKLYIKGNMESFTEYMGAATFLSITAYLVAGIFNDSVVSVAPLFWILLGMGIGINRLIKDNNSHLNTLSR